MKIGSRTVRRDGHQHRRRPLDEAGLEHHRREITRPTRRITSSTTRRRNGSTVRAWFVDPNAPAGPAYRMTATIYDNNVVTLAAYSSADGLTWRRAGTIQTADGRRIRSPRRGEHRVLGPQDPKIHGPDALLVSQADQRARRHDEAEQYLGWNLVGRSRSTRSTPTTAFGTAAKHRTSIARASCRTSGKLGLPSNSIIRTTRSNPSFMYSRDAAHWSFPDPNKPVIDLSAHGRNRDDFGMAYSASSLIDKDGWLYIYYSWFPEKHTQDMSPAKCTWPSARRPLRGRRVDTGNTGTGPPRTSAKPTIRDG